FSDTLLETNMTERSHSRTLTPPPACRLRAALYWLPAVEIGMAGSPLSIAQLTTSTAVELGGVRQWKRKTPSSLWMSPRQSLSSGLVGIRYSDIMTVLEVPSVMWRNWVVRGVARLPLTCENGALPLPGGTVSYLGMPQLTT